MAILRGVRCARRIVRPRHCGDALVHRCGGGFAGVVGVVRVWPGVPAACFQVMGAPQFQPAAGRPGAGTPRAPRLACACCRPPPPCGRAAGDIIRIKHRAGTVSRVAARSTPAGFYRPLCSRLRGPGCTPRATRDQGGGPPVQWPAHLHQVPPAQASRPSFQYRNGEHVAKYPIWRWCLLLMSAGA